MLSWSWPIGAKSPPGLESGEGGLGEGITLSPVNEYLQRKALITTVQQVREDWVRVSPSHLSMSTYRGRRLSPQCSRWGRTGWGYHPLTMQLTGTAPKEEGCLFPPYSTPIPFSTQLRMVWEWSDVQCGHHERKSDLGTPFFNPFSGISSNINW